MPKLKLPVRKSGRAAQGPSRVMKEDERDALRAQIEAEKSFQASLGRDLPDDGTFGALREANDLGVSKAKIGRRVAGLSKALAEGEAPVLRGAQRNAAVARFRHLEGQLPEILLTRREQDLFPRDGHDYHAAVRKASKHEVGNPETQKMIAEFRRLGRALFPEDAERSSIERLRKAR